MYISTRNWSPPPNLQQPPYLCCDNSLRQSHGPQLLSANQTLFRLWAPDACQVAVEFKDGTAVALTGLTGGWFAAAVECGAGTPYHFVIDDKFSVPDPASRSQPSGIHGFSQVVDHKAYQWMHEEWLGRPWHQAIIYELHAGLLNGFSGVSAYLPYLKQLGVTAVELMPIGQFPGTRNWGYDGVLPFASQASYGAPDSLKDLVDTAHGLGLMVYVDVVYNHFGPDGNYLPQYASPFFRDDRVTPWGKAIDFRRREVRDYFCENALMWIMDYRIDGLRFDAVHAISDTGFLTELARRVRAATGAIRHVHLVLENESNDVSLLEEDFDAQWNDDGHNILHAILSGEGQGYYRDFSSQPTRQLARCLHEGFIYQGQRTTTGQQRGEPSGHLPPTSFVLFLQNHDQIGNRALGERLISLTDEDALKAATALLLLCPMVPLLFMGEERGARQPFLYFTDHREPLAQAVHSGRQKEFQHFSAFGSDAGLRIPDPNHPRTFAASRPSFESESQADSAMWHHYYAELLRLRHQHILPRLPGSRALGVEILGEAAVVAQWIMGDASILRIALNLGTSGQRDGTPRGTNETIFTHRSDARTGQLNPGSVAAQLMVAP